MKLLIQDYNKPELSLIELDNIFKMYSSISIKFEIYAEYIINNDGKGKWKLDLVERERKYKDYDEFESPLRWLETWDTTNWGIIQAYDENKLVGGAIIVWKTHGVNMLEGKDDRAVLWDIRVNEEYRGKGVGSNLFRFYENWAKNRKCKELIIETQTNNVGAMNFYAKMGCEIYKVNKNAYTDLPDEVQVLYRKAI